MRLRRANNAMRMQQLGANKNDDAKRQVSKPDDNEQINIVDTNGAIEEAGRPDRFITPPMITPAAMLRPAERACLGRTRSPHYGGLQTSQQSSC